MASNKSLVCGAGIMSSTTQTLDMYVSVVP